MGVAIGDICSVANRLIARGFQITYETPKSEQLTLFSLGERTYDHLVFLPTKVKGTMRFG